MASGIGKISTKHFDCAICLERLKEPKLLTCQHTYCRECLEQLVTADDWLVGRKVTCPECREITRIPVGGIKGLQSNFFVNKLLSELDGQSTAIPSCEEHGGETFKHFCQTCDQLICQHCIVIDHRDHTYELLKDIYPAEKEKIEKIVEKSRAKILALENSLETLNLTESRIQGNGKDVSSKIDTFIDQQIEILQKKRQSLKDELQELTRVQKEQHEIQKKPFFSLYLGRMKQSVEFAEQALSRGNEVEVLAAKKQLNQLNSATVELQPHNMVSYDLEIDSPLDKKMVSKIAKIQEYDEEYDIKMQKNWSSQRHFVSYFHEENRQFEIRRKTSKTSFDPLPVDKVQVKIKRQGSNHVDLPPIDKNSEDGSFTFSYCPPQDGDYQIEVFVNGRFLSGSPFEWEVQF